GVGASPQSLPELYEVESAGTLPELINALSFGNARGFGAAALAAPTLRTPATRPNTPPKTMRSPRARPSRNRIAFLRRLLEGLGPVSRCATRGLSRPFRPIGSKLPNHRTLLCSDHGTWSWPEGQTTETQRRADFRAAQMS